MAEMLAPKSDGPRARPSYLHRAANKPFARACRPGRTLALLVGMDPCLRSSCGVVMQFLTTALARPPRFQAVAIPFNSSGRLRHELTPALRVPDQPVKVPTSFSTANAPTGFSAWRFLIDRPGVATLQRISP